MTQGAVPAALLLPGVLAAGLALILLAAVTGLRATAQRRRKHLLERLSGRTPTRGVKPAVETAATLRRPDTRGWATRLLPAISAQNMALIGERSSRIGAALCLAAATLVAFALWWIALVNPLVGAALGLVPALPLWLAWRRAALNRRTAAIDESVPEALDMIVRSLRIGQPITTAIQAVGNSLTGPLAQEFAAMAERISYGKDVTEALRETAERCRNQNLRFLAAAVAIQYASGGNLADVLERLGAIARGRQQMRRKVRAITAEAKWTGMFLSAFPLVAAAGLMAINPGYFSEISDKTFFLPMLAVVGILLVLNLLFMRRIARIE